MSSTAPATRSDWVEERLRAAILSGELGPGQRLQATDLAERWEVSATPLREAIQRLAGDGLVEVLAQRGARVSQLSIADAANLYELRLLLEPVALRRSLAASDDDHRAAMRVAFAELRSAATVEDGIEAHSRFHTVLLERCPSPWMLRFTTQLADASRLFQVTSLTTTQPRRHAVEEHHAILDAASRGDIDACVDLHVRHLRRTLELIGAPPPD